MRRDPSAIPVVSHFFGIKQLAKHQTTATTTLSLAWNLRRFSSKMGTGSFFVSGGENKSITTSSHVFSLFFFGGGGCLVNQPTIIIFGGRLPFAKRGGSGWRRPWLRFVTQPGWERHEAKAPNVKGEAGGGGGGGGRGGGAASEVRVGTFSYKLYKPFRGGGIFLFLFFALQWVFLSMAGPLILDGCKKDAHSGRPTPSDGKIMFGRVVLEGETEHTHLLGVMKVQPGERPPARGPLIGQAPIIYGPLLRALVQ